jgi:UPF0716 protein FxsA
VAPAVGGAPSARRRRPRWLAIAFALLLVVPTVEIAAIIGVGKVIGAWPTVLLLLVESALGAWLVRREGGRAWRALDDALRTGRMPSRQLADAALVLVGGTLLLTPGFVTDLVGFFFILPLTRPIARRLLEAAVARRLLSSPIVRGTRAAAGAGAGEGTGRRTRPDVVTGEVVDEGDQEPHTR